MEELFQWLFALCMNTFQLVLACGPVGAAVVGWLAALLPLVKDPLPEPSAGEDRRVAGRRQSSAGDTHQLRDGPSRPGGGGGGVGSALLVYLAAVLPWLELGRRYRAGCYSALLYPPQRRQVMLDPCDVTGMLRQLARC